MGIGSSGAALEGFSRSNVVMLIHVMNEAEVEVIMPVVGKLFDPAFHKPNRQVRPAGSLRRLLGKKNRAEFVCRLEFWIERYGDIQQRIQQVVLFLLSQLVVAKI